MKYIITLIIAALFYSCLGNDKIEKEQIDKFESALGKIETKYLNLLVSDFDSYLSKKYKIENSYLSFKQYLTEVSESSNPDFWKIDKIKLEEIQKTNLLAKYDSIYPDSVWYNNNVINVSYASSNGIINSIALIRKENQEFNIDSLINSIKTKPRLEEIEPSYFKIALESLMQEDALISNYLDAKQAAGSISKRLTASGLLY
ncbi:MAG: hypothetical protein HQ522_02655, partial [Bacteroidetes bacterium]|nr:hypothetical protein [Bacteroidota bacterium]